MARSAQTDPRSTTTPATATRPIPTAPVDEPRGIRRFTAAFRARYSQLPPGLQLVGLQLWLPLFFVCAFCLCYVVAFHQPTVHGAPLGVIGTSAQAQQIETQGAGAFTVSTFDDVVDAKQAVLDGDVAGALDETGSAPTLYIAHAHQYQAATVISTLLTAAFAQRQITLAVDDLAPLPAWDAYGMTPMYVMLALCIGGYMVAMFLGLMGGPLLHRTRIAVIAGGAIIVSAVVFGLAGPVVGAIHGHFLPLWAIGAAWIFTVGVLVNGLSYFFGRFIVAPSILLVVFLSMPASGAAYPVWMLPPFFGAIQHGVIGFGMTEMIKRTIYGVGEPYLTGILELLVYLAVGLLLTFIGKPIRERIDRRRILLGRTTMFADAQAANREHHIAIKERTLAKYGVHATHAQLEEMQDDAEATVTSSIPIVKV